MLWIGSSRPTFSSTIIARAIIAATSILAAVSSQAATIDKAANTTNLDVGGSWVGGITPGFTDVARWASTVSTANTVNLGSNASWRGLAVTNPGGAVSIGAGNTLTLGSAGIDMSAATQNLTVSSGLTLAGGNQVWNIATGRTLALDTGTFTRPAGATLNVQGAGTVSTTMTGLANDATGIIGTWATVGTGTNTHYATISSGEIAAYSGTSVTSFTSPSGTTGSAINYDITNASGTSIGSNRTVNSLRYLAGDISISMNVTYTMNGLINAGTGTITFGGSGALGIGTSGELVINAASGNIVASKVAGTSRNLTIASSSTNSVTLTGTSTYSGNTAITSGTFALGSSGTIAGSPVITVYNGATFDVSAKSTAGLTLGATQSLINNGSVTGNLVVDGTASGSGSITGTLSGTGSINPGSSPGILSAAAVDSATLDFNFEFTTTGSPDFANTSASKNDLLRLTGGTPFATALGAGNAVNIYLNVPSISDGAIFRGGFFTDNQSDFSGSISGASFTYYLADTVGGTTYNGVKYSLYSGGLPASLSTVAALANFAGGDINGQIAQLTFGTIIPEPSACSLLLGSGALAACFMRRRRRS